MNNAERAQAIRKALANFQPTPHGVAVLRSEILKALYGTDLDARGICDLCAPVGVNNPRHQGNTMILETLANLIEAEPTQKAAFVFSEMELANESGDRIVTALRASLPTSARLDSLLPKSYLSQKITEDLGL